jgi:Na+-transporting NADH:ubiquinone oxidoreductase subunit A
MPSYPRPSLSGTFLSSVFGKRRFRVNSNEHGELRAYVMTGEYDRVLPMDILPQHLIKSILYRDYDQMEGLGIYEVVEEDLALCEFVCTSKQPVQRILRQGLDALRTEG